MDYSTHVTERLVKMVLEDTIKVVIDHHFAPQNKKSEIDTGLYECIFRDNKTVDNIERLNLQLEVRGQKIGKKHLKYW